MASGRSIDSACLGLKRRMGAKPSQRRITKKAFLVGLGEAVSVGFGRRVSVLPMPETLSAPADQATPDDLISILKAIPDGRFRRGVR
jgi:hypothetical protein